MMLPAKCAGTFFLFFVVHLGFQNISHLSRRPLSLPVCSLYLPLQLLKSALAFIGFAFFQHDYILGGGILYILQYLSLAMSFIFMSVLITQRSSSSSSTGPHIFLAIFSSNILSVRPVSAVVVQASDPKISNSFTEF